MSLQGLMALLGHVTPEMTLPYATLADPTLRAGYDTAIGKVRRELLSVAPAGRPPVPPKVEWMASEYLGDPRRDRHLLPPPRRGGLSLREHLRDLRGLRARPGIHAGTLLPAR